MSITFVGSNISGFGTGNITVTLPATVQNDLVFIITGSDNETVGPPSTSGYTFVADVTASVGSRRLCIFRKFMGAPPDTSVTVPNPNNYDAAALVLVFQGVNTTTPLDVAVTTLDQISAGVPDPSAITPVSNDCCIVAAAMTDLPDTSVGSITNYLPSPSVQKATGIVTVAAAYRILSGGAATSENPLAWSTWSATSYLAATIALRPLTASVDLVAVDRATITATGKTVAVLETVPVLKTSVAYSGKVVTIPDARVEAIFVDKYRIAYVGQTVNPGDIIRAVTVTQAAVLCRGRTVTPREIQFEDIPHYSVRGRGSGHWMETR